MVDLQFQKQTSELELWNKNCHGDYLFILGIIQPIQLTSEKIIIFLLWFLCYAVSRHWMIPRTFWESDVGDQRNQKNNVCSLWFNQQTLEVHGSSVANTGRDLEWTTSRNQILLPNFRQLWVRFKVFSGDTSSVDELATWVDAAVGDVESGSFGTEHHWDTPEGLMKVWRVYLIRPLTFGGFKHVFLFCAEGLKASTSLVSV